MNDFTEMVMSLFGFLFFFVCGIVLAVYPGQMRDSFVRRRKIALKGWGCSDEEAERRAEKGVSGSHIIRFIGIAVTVMGSLGTYAVLRHIFKNFL